MDAKAIEASDDVVRPERRLLHELQVQRRDPAVGREHLTEVALALREFAPSVGGRQQMAIECFADAIEIGRAHV